LNDTGRLFELLQQTQESRDQEWLDQFLLSLSGATLWITSENAETFVGPDFINYLPCFPEDLSAKNSLCIRDDIEKLTGGVLGLAIMRSGSSQPEYVISPGQLASFRMLGEFCPPPTWSGMESQNGSNSFSGGSVQVGQPNLDYLPEFLKQNIRSALNYLGVGSTEVVLVFSESTQSRFLAFCIDDRSSRLEVSAATICQYLVSVLPPGYGIMAWNEGLAGRGSPI
jgi:hypothetical protein